MKEADLEKPGAHVLIADDQQRLHLLVKDSAAKKVGLESIDAELVDKKREASKSVKVSESPEALDLGDLGKWRDFVVDGIELGPDTKVGTPTQPIELHLFSAGKDADVGSAFYTSVDLGFALAEIVLGEDLAVRPVPVGDRAGKSFVELTPQLKEVVHKLLDRWVDHTVPAETVANALSEWRNLQSSVIDSGLIGAALSLGLVPSRPEVKKPKPETAPAKAEAKAQEGELDGLGSYLAELGMALPEKPTASWAESAIDALPEGAPDAYASQLRNLYVKLSEQKESELDSLFGDELGESKPATNPEGVQAGSTRFEKSKELRRAQLAAALDGYDVGPKEVRTLADLLAAALMPSAKPAVIIVAGPPHSAADVMFDATTEMISKKPLDLGREDLGDAGFPGVYGNIKGVPTQADALLSKSRLGAARDTPASQALVLLRNLEAVGASKDPEEQQAIQLDWLGRLREMGTSGKVNTYAKENGISSEMHEVNLANTVFLMRWNGAPEELDYLLKADPKLATFATKTISVGQLPADAGIRFLEDRLAFRLRQQDGAQNGVKVTIGPELRQALATAYGDVGASAAFERYVDGLFEELFAVAQEHPADGYQIEWSKKLTKKDREKVIAGEPIAFTPRQYSIAPK